MGRVGELAVALGIGAAMFAGTGTAWAGPSSPDSSSETSESSDSTAPSAEAAASSSGASSTATDSSGGPAASPTTDSPVSTVSATTVTISKDDDTTEEVSGDDEEVGDADEPPNGPRTKKTWRPPEKFTTPPVSEVAANEIRTSVSSVAAQPETKTVERRFASAVAAQRVAREPAVPSLRPWPTAFDPTTVLTYVTGLVTSVVSAILSPFAAGAPALPSDPSPWALLAWVRRELFNESPTVTGGPQSQSLNLDGDVIVTGTVGAGDGDGDPVTYTVVGRPLNGGTVTVDQHGAFTYRPMNAMAAVGGTDQFTVVVSDEAAGFHVHGLTGLLQFVPILGSFLNPGAGHRIAQTITVTVTPVDGVDLTFPADFHWGVAHAGFQAEGGPGSPVDPNSDWYRWVHDPINQLLGLTHGVPENGPGTYVSYDTDARLAHDDLGMNTFRMSIEWSRIFPNSTALVDISDEGGTVSLADLQALDQLADQDEVAHYRAVFASLRAHGLDPLVTVNHFTLPTWVHDPITARPLVQLGLPAPAAGWLTPTTPAEFEKFAAYVAWKYGDQVDDWATLNEPFSPILTEFFAIPGLVPAWPPGVIRPDLASTFLVNEAKGHVAAYDAIHLWDNVVATPGNPAAFVGFTNNMIPARPADPVNSLDVQAAAAWNSFYDGWFPNAVIDGWVDANFDGVKTPNEVYDQFKGKADWMGVQYYGSQPMKGFGVAPIPGFPFLRGLPVRCTPSPTCSDFNQPTDPGGFREVLELAASYGTPLWVTENGIADAGDSKRPPYLVNHIAVVQDMVAHDTDILGYTYWSFVDNLEWAEGYDLQFGLYGSDPTTPELERTPKPASISAISQITKANELPTSLLATYVP